jgi:hypothetical protein
MDMSAVEGKAVLMLSLLMAVTRTGNFIPNGWLSLLGQPLSCQPSPWHHNSAQGFQLLKSTEDMKWRGESGYLLHP